MIIALPATDHDHLADALVRDLGFTRTHVDQPLRDLLLALDPIVDNGVYAVNKAASGNLSFKLEQLGGSWERLLNPPRPSSSGDGVAKEVKRLLGVLRGWGDLAPPLYPGDTVIVGYPPETSIRVVAIKGRVDDGVTVDHWIEPAGVVGEQQAIVAYVQELREAKAVPALPQTDEEFASLPVVDLDKFLETGSQTPS